MVESETYGLGFGEEIPDDQWHILAFEREGLPLEPCFLDPVSGKINGEGPLRNIIPPGSSGPALNTPDRGRNADTSGCKMREWDYDPAKDHNAGRMAKGAVILRIQPMPEGCEEFDLINGGSGRSFRLEPQASSNGAPPRNTRRKTRRACAIAS